MNTIHPKEALKRSKSGEDLFLDVRTPAEIRECSIGNCLHIPHDQVVQCPELDKLPRDQSIVLVCGSGKRAEIAGEKLTQKGFTNLVVMEGGVQEWRNHDLPVVEGKGAISLERQVRIAAGSLVALGSVMAWFNPVWLVLPAFVGLGLSFAGITDTCGMGLMLARMPWNR